MSGRAKPERGWWVTLCGFCVCAAATSAAPPDGSLVEGISDECETLSPIWSAGLRGFPEALAASDGVLSIRSVDDGDDDYPSAEDMISTYADQLGRPLEAAEGPSVMAWVWVPPFNEWSTGVNASGYREWFGVRVTALDPHLPQLGGFYFPGVYFATEDEGPSLIARVGDGYAPDITIGRVAVAGWWTVGLGFNDEGTTEYYAAPGRVGLTSADLLHVTPLYSDPMANRSITQLIGNFIALRMTYPPTGQLSPDWRLDNFRVFVRRTPALPRVALHLFGAEVQLALTPGERGFRYLVQRSEDLLRWNTVSDYVGDGAERSYTEAAGARGFYRVTRP